MHNPFSAPLHVFIGPSVVFVLLAAGLWGSTEAYLAALALGLFTIVRDSYREIREGRYSLDYVAFLALLVALFSHHYLAGAIVALMFTGGKALEHFASERAETALRALGDNIPKRVFVYRDGSYDDVPLKEVREGERIMVKKGEMAPLDGFLFSPRALFDLATLTGEAGPRTIAEGVLIKSGSINVGETVELTVHGDFSSSTYHRIVELVARAKEEPAHLVRLSQRANIYFTLITLVLVAVAYAIGDMTRVLAVLVIATPCPLIIAAPVAFISGMSRAARRGIVVRRPALFELLARTTTIFFDKTGTLTLGEPRLARIELLSAHGGNLSEADVMRIAASLELHSLHPLARALVSEAEARGVKVLPARDLVEKLGEGIEGVVDGARYAIRGVDVARAGITLSLTREGQECARFHFLDQIKVGAHTLLRELKTRGFEVAVITGDTRENALEIFDAAEVTIYADVSPLDKHTHIARAKAEGKVVVMLGDGLNDAPALARADVGIVFSNTENAASVDAADVVFLDRNIDSLRELFATSSRTVAIARQSIVGGIALSLVGMVCAALGYIQPVYGALLQEAIDVVVIVNALRALRG